MISTTDNCRAKLLMKEKRQVKRRLDDLLVELGYFEDLRTAQAWIMSGNVVVDGRVVTKSGTKLSSLPDIHLRGLPLKFASRGGYKLEHALRRFSIDVNGLICLDGGASTGGFTDCLLQNGAARVYAVEVGFGQLRGKLAADPRVVSWERTNISDVNIDDLSPPLDFACADLSYLSLRKAVAIIGQLFRQRPHMVFLLKPLYEGLQQDKKANPEALGDIVQKVVTDLTKSDMPPTDGTVSPLLGSNGAVEFLLEFGGTLPQSSDEVIQRIIDELERRPPRTITEYLSEVADSGT